MGFCQFCLKCELSSCKRRGRQLNRRSQLSSYGRPSAMFIPFGLVARIIGHWLSLIGQNVGTLSFFRTRGRPARIYLVIYRTSTHMRVLIWKSPSRCMQNAVLADCVLGSTYIDPSLLLPEASLCWGFHNPASHSSSFGVLKGSNSPSSPMSSQLSPA